MIGMISEWILTILIALPLIGALALLFVSPTNEKFAWRFALGISVVELILSLHLIAHFVPSYPVLQFGQVLPWLPDSMGIKYVVGVDGLSLILVLLTTIICPLIIVSTKSSIEKNLREFLALFLFLECAMIGALVAIDAVLFYVFWEAMLIPMYFMIGIWGGKDRIYATTKFFIYTVIGSLLMLVAFAYLYFAHAAMPGNNYTTNLVELYKTAAALPLETQMWLFGATALAFAIKVPLFPFHTWLPDAHVQAPTPGSVILAAVLLKMGTYGLLRISIPMFPKAAHEFAPYMTILGIVGIIYGALIAWRQTDIKKLVAYSSVSHLGFVIVGMFSFTEMGITGSLYQMINHGISTGALFLLIGVLYERKHTREMADYGGLAKSMPKFAVLFLMATMGSVALPGTGGFIGEWLILLGTFKAWPLAGILAGTGVIFGAVYMLWLTLKVVWGPITKQENETLSDLNGRELFVLGSLAAMIFVCGFASKPILEHTQPTLLAIKKSVDTQSAFQTGIAFWKDMENTQKIVERGQP
jgi:NADH-quinone oxidoreductase subunit M